MSKLQEILSFNKEFVQTKEYEKYSTGKFPGKKMVIVSCMDTRLTELLPRALNMRNGDVKLIKVAGAVVSHPFGSVMRSILVAVYELKADEVFVIGHHGCGMAQMDPEGMMEKMEQRGVAEGTFQTIENSGLSLDKWLHGFDCVMDSVKGSVDIIRKHPLMPKDVPVHGLVIDPDTGELEVVINGYAE